jgi:hypothetical protein
VAGQIRLRACGNRRCGIINNIFHKNSVMHATLHNALGIHSPTARRVYALTFLRPIYPRCGVRSTLTERVYALKRKNLGTPCFLCQILRMSQSTCLGYDLLFMLLTVAGPYPWRMFVLLSPWLQASGPVSQSASSWTAFSSFVSLRYCAHAWLGTLH